MRIALDAMGGDFAPKNIIGGAVLALREYPHIEKLFLVGDSARIESELRSHGCNDPRIEIHHASEVIEMRESAVKAIRQKKDSSVNRAIDLVKHGEAQAIVSAGHTGAAVAATKLKLRTLEGIERPGIACIMPTAHNVFLLVDAGANPDCSPENMLQYAIMGSVYSQKVLGYANPSIGLMSIGDEDLKGNDVTKEAFKLLKASGLNFRGNVEGHDLFENPVEVVVCDGFVGNVVLKTCEAIAKAIFNWIKSEMHKSPIRMLGGKLAKGALKTIYNKTNYEEVGGSPLLGVNGICIIAHGSSTPLAIKNALRVAAESIARQVNPHIVEEVRRYNERIASSSAGTT